MVSFRGGRLAHLGSLDVAPDPNARDLYNRFLGRMGITQKSLAAAARKLAVILWRLYVERRQYRPAII